MSTQLTTGADLNDKPLSRLATPTNPTDGANKAYVDSMAQGLAWKQPVRAASTAAVTLASIITGAQLDGVTLQAGDRVLLKDQTTPASNGIYTVSGSAPVRATDADTSAKLNSATVVVMSGSVNGERTYTQTTDNPTPGTTALVWVQAGGGTAYSAGNGLALNGTTLSAVAKPSGGLTVGSDGIAVDPAYTGLAKRYSIVLPAGATSTDVTHGLGTQDITVSVYDITGALPVLVFTDVTIKSANVVTIGTGAAVTSNQYRVVIVG